MAELKTKKNDSSVMDFINTVESDEKREDSLVLLKLYEDVTGEKAVMWGDSIIGFGTYHYKSERSKQEGDWPLIGFSPRKQQLTLYFMDGFDKHKTDLEKLGKHKVSVGCLYVKRLSEIEMSVLRGMVSKSFKFMKDTHSDV
ncbi:MAG TPA: DUF1801 domain-containing protein [Candidatus Dojkabacteria bacterium]|nr:DUF1801 domain-containing protein [Candidatus Dojkabacteria bacterium]HRP51382.1 DUF1801 domain-containing protein [Candidatus Dojkabacteria bacterium]